MTQHPFFARPVVRHFVKFAIVGVTNTLIDFGIYAGLLFLFHTPYLLAKIVAFIIAVTWSYFLNRRWTFKNDEAAWKTQLGKFVVVTLIGLGLNLVLLYIFVEHWPLSRWVHITWPKFDELFGYVVATGLVMIWNFVANRWWTFRVR